MFKNWLNKNNEIERITKVAEEYRELERNTRMEKDHTIRTLKKERDNALEKYDLEYIKVQQLLKEKDVDVKNIENQYKVIQILENGIEALGKENEELRLGQKALTKKKKEVKKYGV